MWVKNLLKKWADSSLVLRIMVGLVIGTLQLQDAAQESAPGALKEVFLNLLTNIVSNPVFSVSSANYIGILFWSVLVGLGLIMVASQATIKVVAELADVVTLVVKWVIQFAPFGILGLVFSAVSQSGMEVFTTYGSLVLLLLVPLACSFLGIGNDVAMLAVAVGFIIGVVQDSVETALNSSGDVFFTATAERRER